MVVDWERIREECIRTGNPIRIDKSQAQTLPPHFRETDMGLSKGELRQFRDENPTQSLHIHEFPDHYVAHVDLFNPNFHPLAHGILDTPGIAIGIMAGAVATFLVSKTLNELDFLPSHDQES